LRLGAGLAGTFKNGIKNCPRVAVGSRAAE
jgi:hypothetical protein